MAKNYLLSERATKALDDLLRRKKERTSSGKARQIPNKSFLAELVNLGPASEANYTDQRYWVRENFISNTDGDYTSDITMAQGTVNECKWVTATNLQEVVGETHTLPDDKSIYIEVFVTHDQSGTPRYYFNGLFSSNSDAFLAKVTAAVAGSRYTVTEQEITSSATDTLVFGNLSGGRVVTATNLAEVAIGTNELWVDGSIKVMVFSILDAGPLPRYVFYSLGDIQDPSAPEAIGVAPEGSDSADSETWDRENPDGAKDGCTINMTTRVVYDAAVNQVLRGYYRTLTFDAFGRLTDISGESAYIIDTPLACP